MQSICGKKKINKGEYVEFFSEIIWLILLHWLTLLLLTPPSPQAHMHNSSLLYVVDFFSRRKVQAWWVLVVFLSMTYLVRGSCHHILLTLFYFSKSMFFHRCCVKRSGFLSNNFQAPSHFLVATAATDVTPPVNFKTAYWLIHQISRFLKMEPWLHTCHVLASLDLTKNTQD